MSHSAIHSMNDQELHDYLGALNKQREDHSRRLLAIQSMQRTVHAEIVRRQQNQHAA